MYVCGSDQLNSQIGQNGIQTRRTGHNIFCWQPTRKKIYTASAKMGTSGITPTAERPASFFPLGAETADLAVGLFRGKIYSIKPCWWTENSLKEIYIKHFFICFSFWENTILEFMLSWRLKGELNDSFVWKEWMTWNKLKRQHSMECRHGCPRPNVKWCFRI